MKKILYLSILFFFIVIPLFGQDYYFFLDISPNNLGKIESNVLLGYHWNKYILSEINYNYSSFYGEFNVYDGDSISSINKNQLIITPIQIKYDFDLKLFNIGFIGSIDYEIAKFEELRYGEAIYGTGPNEIKVLYKLDQNILYHKPLLNIYIDIDFAFISIENQIKYSFIKTKENIKGTFFVVDDIKTFELNEEGEDLLYYLNIDLNIYNLFIINIDYNYWFHTGKTKDAVIAGGVFDSDTTSDYIIKQNSFSLYLNLLFLRSKPIIGINYTKYNYYGKMNNKDLNININRYKFIIGIKYEL